CATLPASPIGASAVNAFGHRPTPAPTSSSTGACSKTSAARPLRARATAAVSPPIPPPIIAIFGLMPVSSPSLPSSQSQGRVGKDAGTAAQGVLAPLPAADQCTLDVPPAGRSGV